MKKLVLVAAACFMLTACSGSGGVILPEKLQEIVLKICNFKLSQQSAIDIVKASNPIVQTVDMVAQLVCDQVMAQAPVGLLGEPKSEKPCPKGEVNGVCIEGEFDEGGPKEEGK